MSSSEGQTVYQLTGKNVVTGEFEELCVSDEFKNVKFLADTLHASYPDGEFTIIPSDIPKEPE